MKHRAIAVSILIVAGGMLLGRASGLLREIALARVYGLTRAADLATFAMTLPDLLTGILVGGGVGAVLIPEYHRIVDRSGELAGRRLVGQMLLAIIAWSSLLAVALSCLAPLWVRALTPGFQEGDQLRSLGLSRVALLAFPLSAGTAVATALLQIRQRLTTATLGTAVFNLMTIAVILGFSASHAPSLAVWGVVAGAAARLLLQLVAAARDGGLQGVFYGWSRFDHLSWGMAVRYCQSLGAIGIAVFLPTVARAFASGQPGGAAAVTYALKLSEVPTGLCSAVLTMIVLPRVSQAMQSGGEDRASRLLLRSGLAAIGLLIPALVIYQWAADPIVSLLFRHGQLSAESARQVAELSRITMLGVPASIVASLATMGFHTRRDSATPLRWGLATLAVLVAAGWSASRQWGMQGVVATTVIANCCYAAGLTAHLIRALRNRPVAASEEPVPLARAA